MNQQQRKYLLNRISSLASEKTLIFKKNNMQAKSLSIEEKKEQIRAGIAVLKPDYIEEMNSYTRAYDLYNFQDDSIEANKEISAKYTAYRKLIEKESLALKDEIMLGDSEKALLLLAAFEEL